MKKNEKTQCIEMVKSLEEAQEVIIRYIEKNSIILALKLLEECQQAAICVGEFIEKIEIESVEAVRGLENYCELIYQMSESIYNGKSIDVEQARDGLNNLLWQIEKEVDSFPTKIEVVFLPYKASMWDSLQSIWEAADKDPNCDAYVVPIPYYDKNSDGSYRALHYEVNQYPKNVPVVSYKEYDLEKRHPDMIFIHNPYDNTNFVTTVDPRFYSGKLKNYTDKLIYVPYFVLGEVDPENKEAVESIEHFVRISGVMNADKVIVQSEQMRQVYVDVLTKYSEERIRPYWEQKILGLGSPKFDGINSAEARRVELPKEWLEIIKRKDGNWKKIILYNTGVDALRAHGSKMLSKMKKVFQIFEENREEIALIWRPHPLMEATISSMHPQLLDDYQKLANWYREAGWGIYDDTADLDRVIALSDGYYGDGSSLVQLCKEVEIPAMIQAIDIE